MKCSGVAETVVFLKVNVEKKCDRLQFSKHRFSKIQHLFREWLQEWKLSLFHFSIFSLGTQTQNAYHSSKERRIFPFSCKYRTFFIEISFLASPLPAIEIFHKGNPKIAPTVIARIWRRFCMSESPSFILIVFCPAGNSEINLSSRHWHVKVTILRTFWASVQVHFCLTFQEMFSEGLWSLKAVIDWGN